jgi:hypothetical protein
VVLERKYCTQFSRPEVQLTLQNNVTNIAAEFTIHVTGEKAEKIDSRGKALRARTLELDRADAMVGAFAMRGAGDRSNYVKGRRRDWMREMEAQPGYGSDEALVRSLGGWTG